MGDYIVIAPTAAADPSFVSHIQRHLEEGGWSKAAATIALTIWVRGPSAPPVQTAPLGVGFVIGRLLRRLDGTRWRSSTADAPCEPLEAAQTFARAGWGAYIALWGSSSLGAPAIFRDPTAALEAFLWERDGVVFVSSSLSQDLQSLLGQREILWDRVAAWLTDTTEIAGDLAIADVVALAPGEFRNSLHAKGSSLWSPADIAREGRSTFRSQPRALASSLRTCVDRTVAALPAFGKRALVEVSGGLDSAVVATSARRVASLEVPVWLNFRGRDPGADETVYAQAVVKGLGVNLTVLDKPDVALTEGDLRAVSRGARPGLDGMDPQYDREVLAQAQACGAEMILTGQGGDTVFYAAISPFLASEVLLRPWWSGCRRRLHALAVELNTTTRLLQIAGRRALKEPIASLGARLSVCNEGLSPLAKPTVPWINDLEGLTPAKRFQILQLAHSLLYRTDCERGRAYPLVHVPLLQPIVELALSIPAEQLTPGAEGRALLKQAFADRLPQSVRKRRSKGDLTAYYGRMIANSLDLLRPFLLDGLLAQRGLIDRARLEAFLDPDDLAWRGGYADLMDVIGIEAWVRHWSERASVQTSGAFP